MAKDYSEPTGNSGMDDMPTGDAPAGDMPDKMEQNTVTLPQDMLPPGFMPKDGDKLTFCVEGEPDENGVKGYFEAPKAEEEDWESGFKKSMSARDDGNDTEM